MEELGIEQTAHSTQQTANKKNTERETRAPLGDEERAVWAQLSADEPCDVDAVAAHSGLPAGACAATLTALALKRIVRQLPGQRYVRMR